MRLILKKKYNIFINMLSLYLFIIPLDFIPIISGISVSRIMIVLPIIGWILDRRKKSIISEQSIILVYLIVFAISIPFSMEMSISISKYLTIFLNACLVVLLTLREYDKYEVDFLKKVAAKSGWLLLILCILFSNTSLMAGRLIIVVNGTKLDPNEMCGFFLLPICYYVNDYLERRKMFSLFAIILFLGVIVMSGSRGGLLSVAVAILVLFIKENHIKNKLLWLFVGIIFVYILFITFINYLPLSLVERFSLRYTLAENTSDSSRQRIWAQLLDAFASGNILRQFFGFGLASAPLLNGSGSVAHNLYIETLIETGILGLGTLFIFYHKVILMANRIEEKYLLGCFWGYLSMGLTLSIYCFKPMWNVILLIILSYLCQENTDSMRINNESIICDE